MRPVERGDPPLDTVSKLPIQFREYGDAKPALIERLGCYCSYCEQPILNQPAVEHVLSKSEHAQFERAWPNLLLACAVCNSIKGREHLAVQDYFWPDRDNTLRAVSYGAGGTVTTGAGLSPDDYARGRRTIELTGLDRHPAGDVEPSPRDSRWKQRLEVWEIALEMKADLREQDTERMRRYIERLACSKGFWSVWMTVFADDVDMRRRLIAAFPGTSRVCFDEQTCLVARPSGAL